MLRLSTVSGCCKELSRQCINEKSMYPRLSEFISFIINRENITAELFKDPSTKDEDLAAIKDWLRMQPHLPDEWEDSCLVSFLRGCNFSLEKCKRKLDIYFTMKAACPEFFANRDILRPELLDLMVRAQDCTMPGLTPKGWRVTIVRGVDSSLETEQLLEAMKILMMVVDLRIREKKEGVTGEACILDAKTVKASHLRTLSPSLVKKFLICVQEAYPVKLKEVHVVNASGLMDAMFAIVKPFLKEKIKRRIYFHKDYKSMQEYVPKHMLPKEYCGTGPSLDELNQTTLEKLIENRDWFMEQESLKANEALRPGKPTNYAEIFGVEGSFRQLTID